MAGRPTDYKKTYDNQAYKLALLGATDKEMSNFFDVSEVTFNAWKKKFPQFLKSINKGKIKADALVAESLFKRAVGFTFDEVTFEKVDSKVNLEITSAEEMKTDESYKKKVVTKLIVGDVAAQNIWLKNRRNKIQEGGQRWADKQETGFTDKDGEDLKGLPIVFK